MSDIERLNEYISESNRIVFFGGAGVSTESGIPDFRSSDGLYSKKYAKIQPEEILSHNFFYQHTRDFYDFYKNKMLYLDAKPNITHYKLAELEEAGKLLGIITQNIDGLHQMAGSKNVLELHGSVYRNYCTQCHKSYTIDKIINQEDNYPLCDDCGSIVRPDVVLYNEKLPMDVFDKAEELVSQADMLIIGGTSLSVYPACNLIYSFRGEHLVIINKSELGDTFKLNPNLDLAIKSGLGDVFSQIVF
jgi:NAD-dependent deacetylase